MQQHSPQSRPVAVNTAHSQDPMAVATSRLQETMLQEAGCISEREQAVLHNPHTVSGGEHPYSPGLGCMRGLVAPAWEWMPQGPRAAKSQRAQKTGRGSDTAELWWRKQLVTQWLLGPPFAHETSCCTQGCRWGEVICMIANVHLPP